MNKKIWIQILQWPIAIVIGFLIINIVCFLYERPVGWLDTPNGPSQSLRRPNSIMVHGQEGYSFTKLDKNGYANPDGILADEYILMCGASHTLAKEVAQDKKYSALVNQYLSDDGLLHTYNIGADSHFLTTQIEHFRAAMEAYPDASMVTIEIGSTEFDVEKMMNMVQQVEYDPDINATVFETNGLVEKGKIFIKEFMPFISLIKTQISTWEKNEGPTIVAQAGADRSFSFELSDYKIAADQVLSVMASQSNGKLVFVYHPKIGLTPNGMLEIYHDDTYDMFQELCAQYDIGLIDVSERFEKLYKYQHKLPYGFFNTTIGAGHLNGYGHQIMADAIIEYWEETKK